MSHIETNAEKKLDAIVRDLTNDLPLMDSLRLLSHVRELVSQIQTDSERAAVQAFYDRVCHRAEQNMLKTNRVEGAHFAAMNVELAALPDTLEDN